MRLCNMCHIAIDVWRYTTNPPKKEKNSRARVICSFPTDPFKRPQIRNIIVRIPRIRHQGFGIIIL